MGGPPPVLKSPRHRMTLEHPDGVVTLSMASRNWLICSFRILGSSRLRSTLIIVKHFVACRSYRQKLSIVV